MQNNLSHAIRKFNRFELKYLVRYEDARLFKHALRAHLVPDDRSMGNGSYFLSSLYYDSPDYRFYWEKVDGVRYRRKLRIRHYENGEVLCENTPVFIEIKQRVDRVTQKRRVVLPYRAALQLCNDRVMPEHDPQDEAVIEEIMALLWMYNLHSSSLVRYARYALIGSDYDLGLRVTFDNDLVYRTERLEMHEAGCELMLFPPGWTVVEIKVNERIPYWLTELVAGHNLTLVRVSKYCRSIELAQNLPQSMQLVMN